MTLDKVLNIYISWIKIYIEEAKKLNLTDHQIQVLLTFYRAPLSEQDWVFMTYCHDAPKDCLDEDLMVFRGENYDFY